MILITGGTGFIGRALVRQLFESGYPVRTLLRPSPRTPRLPKGVPVEVAVVGLGDVRGLRAALRDVDTVIHLAGTEHQGRNANLLAVDILGTRNLAQAAKDAGVGRFIYLSHIGADRASAFPVHKAKGIAEEHIRKSGVPHTIVRSSIVYGPEDHFTTDLAGMLRRAPIFFPLPGDGQTRIQPLWVEDLITCLLWAMESAETVDKTYEVGGSEYFTVRQTLEQIMAVTGKRRLLVPIPPPFLRALVVTLETFIPSFPASSFWIDYYAVHRTCPVDNLPRSFGLMPARFTYRLDYLVQTPWYIRWRQSLAGMAARVTSRVNHLFHPTSEPK
jgi:NADH dehydrogenase